MSTPLIIPSVQIKRGSLVLMPELLPGEQYWAKDTNQLFIGTAEGNKDITDKYTRAEIETRLAGQTLWVGTQSEYDLIDPKDEDTLYFVKEDPEV